MIYLLLWVASSVVAVVDLPLLLPQPKPPPEADKSPGPPQLAITVKKLSAWELSCLVRPPRKKYVVAIWVDSGVLLGSWAV